jgi:PPOX class probable F420-dependent enzyme
MSDAITLADDVRALFDGPNYVHLSTLRADGTPRNWVVWAATEGDRIIVCTGERSWKARDMVRNPAVALSVTDFDDPYRMAAVQGRVVEVRDDGDGAIMDAISNTYTGRSFPMRGPGRVCFVIEPVRAAAVALDFKHDPG